ncbi:transmembrane anchor protein [Brevundimonas sp. AJA228-03]|uniref:transmembrane anchor protein n=1 Tax=Brevundimonas sp. AJA228-03 TaxID=2752515 RepID=UPI001ADF3D08|nr:transmembrane anchor protein [Brevundimonas sp. AJA228-03]QTN20886.1 transmembrane anchor protein [Brevundimonas sp. AJA228-03]
MYNANKPDASELPSTAKLLKSTGIAVVVASALLVTVVLPAEYGIDPTRVGSLLGLTEMGRIKRQLAAEAAAEEAGAAPQAVPIATTPLTPPMEPPATGAQPGTAAPPVAPPAAPPAAAGPAPVTAATTPGTPVRSDRTSLTLEPDEGGEIKLTMKEGDRAEFTWSADGGAVNYDTHGDGRGISYHGYGKGTDTRVQGVLVAAFDGKHGWFWRNRGDEPVTITLVTNGAYERVEFIE